MGRHRIESEQNSRIVDLYEKGHTFTEIGKMLNISAHNVRTVCMVRTTLRKTKRYDMKRIKRIFTMYSEGYTLSHIGEVFGISKQRVHQIVNFYHANYYDLFNPGE